MFWFDSSLESRGCSRSLTKKSFLTHANCPKTMSCSYDDEAFCKLLTLTLCVASELWLTLALWW